MRQFIVGKPLPINRAEHHHKAVTATVGAAVEPKNLLVKIAVQVERLHTNVRAFQAPFQQRLKVL
jgi:hypothetical protein